MGLGDTGSRNPGRKPGFQLVYIKLKLLKTSLYSLVYLKLT